MKKKLAAILSTAIIFIGLSGCSTTPIGNGVDSTLQTSQTAESSTVNISYLPIPMEKFLRIEEGDITWLCPLLGFAAILQEANISVIEIMGASGANSYSYMDSGDVRFDADWDMDFSSQMGSLYDMEKLADLVENQEIEAIYIKTPYEIYTFKSSTPPYPPSGIQWNRTFKIFSFQRNENDKPKLCHRKRHQNRGQFCKGRKRVWSGRG